jgi:hypothetical protein
MSGPGFLEGGRVRAAMGHSPSTVRLRWAGPVPVSPSDDPFRAPRRRTAATGLVPSAGLQIHTTTCAHSPRPACGERASLTSLSTKRGGSRTAQPAVPCTVRLRWAGPVPVSPSDDPFRAPRLHTTTCAHSPRPACGERASLTSLSTKRGGASIPEPQRGEGSCAAPSLPHSATCCAVYCEAPLGRAGSPGRRPRARGDGA